MEGDLCRIIYGKSKAKRVEKAVGSVRRQWDSAPMQRLARKSRATVGLVVGVKMQKLKEAVLLGVYCGKVEIYLRAFGIDGERGK